MRAPRRRNSTTEHGHAVLTREYQSDPWSEERSGGSAPRSPPHRTQRNHPKNQQIALTEVAPYQERDGPTWGLDERSKTAASDGAPTLGVLGGERGDVWR